MLIRSTWRVCQLGVMRNQIGSVTRSCSALFAGGMMGYFLWSPLINIPMQVGGPWLLPLARVIDPYLSDAGAGYVTTAIMVFFLNLPNTLLMALLAVLAMKLLRLGRMLFFPVFAWPLVVYTAYWAHVWMLKVGAERLGLPSDMDRLPVDVTFPHKALVIFLTYTFFSLFVVIAARRLLHPTDGASLSIDLQASQ